MISLIPHDDMYAMLRKLDEMSESAKRRWAKWREQQ